MRPVCTRINFQNNQSFLLCDFHLACHMSGPAMMFDHLGPMNRCSCPSRLRSAASLVRFASREPTLAQVVKFDVETGQTRMWHEPGSICLGAHWTASLYHSGGHLRLRHEKYAAYTVTFLAERTTPLPGFPTRLP